MTCINTDIMVEVLTKVDEVVQFAELYWTVHLKPVLIRR